jgi:hypothetical protein
MNIELLDQQADEPSSSLKLRGLEDQEWLFDWRRKEKAVA